MEKEQTFYQELKAKGYTRRQFLKFCGIIFLPHETLPLALGQFKGEHSLDIPIILSVLVLSVMPMIILFIIFQDKLVKGMMAGAVKG